MFSLLYLSPGDPAAIIAGDTATDEDIAPHPRQARARRAVCVQFGTWVWALLHGDLGISIFTNLPVIEADRAAGRADGRADDLRR